MSYVGDRFIHDADAHIMELPTCLDDFIDPAFREPLIARIRAFKTRFPSAGLNDVVVLKHDDPEFRAGAEAELLTRKMYAALGSFRREDRPQSLDLLGFASQLVFTSFCLRNFYLDDADVGLAYAAARAHNRMMVDFCSVDRRLLPTAYVPLASLEEAPRIAREAIELGAKGLMIPSQCPKGHGPSHVGLEPLWSAAAEAGLPILFHVGGQEPFNVDYARNGGAVELDFLGGAENFTSVSFMAIPHSVEQTLATLIFDGVMDRHPTLKFGVIEMGASWIPSWMRFMDASHRAFHKEERQQRLSALPSEIVRRQVRATPYPHEDAGWIIQNAGEEVCMFSSDYPHVEGGRNPLKRFDESLDGLPEGAKRRFYSANFADLMGRGLDPALDRRPAVAA
jgi:predicted TIM-barrel fold metal-dependent hydrolase